MHFPTEEFQPDAYIVLDGHHYYALVRTRAKTQNVDRSWDTQWWDTNSQLEKAKMIKPGLRDIMLKRICGKNAGSDCNIIWVSIATQYQGRDTAPSNEEVLNSTNEDYKTHIASLETKPHFEEQEAAYCGKHALNCALNNTLMRTKPSDLITIARARGLPAPQGGDFDMEVMRDRIRDMKDTWDKQPNKGERSFMWGDVRLDEGGNIAHGVPSERLEWSGGTYASMAVRRKAFKQRTTKAMTKSRAPKSRTARSRTAAKSKTRKGKPTKSRTKAKKSKAKSRLRPRVQPRAKSRKSTKRKTRKKLPRKKRLSLTAVHYGPRGGRYRRSRTGRKVYY